MFAQLQTIMILLLQQKEQLSTRFLFACHTAVLLKSAGFVNEHLSVTPGRGHENERGQREALLHAAE